MSVHNKHYRHLNEPDIGVTLEFLFDHRTRLHSIQFDIPVGEGYDPGPDHDDNIRRMSKLLTQRRIDAVADTADATLLIEICQTASYKTIGQLEVYRLLYQEQHQPTRPLRTVAVCRHAPPEVAAAIRAAGHELLIYPASPQDAAPGLPDAID